MDKRQTIYLDPNMDHYRNRNLVVMVQDCEATCEHMTHSIMMLDDFHDRMAQAVLVNDCAAICGLTANFAARDAIFARHAAALCADICDALGSECIKFSDEKSVHCADICFACARHCKAFAIRKGERRD
ncbi:MAG: ferredoxin [Anaerocolumna sp.]|jgi:hypothetical protein|nr:ferredoxin [Anaerocolumna sp.]